MHSRSIRALRSGPRRQLTPLVKSGLVIAALALVTALTSGCGGAKQAQGQSSKPARSPKTADPSGTHGEIVLQKARMTLIFALSHSRPTHEASTLTSITETAADGSAVRRSFDAQSSTRPGFEEARARNVLELYDPLDNTIYETTRPALERAQMHQLRRSLPRNGRGSTRATQLAAPYGADPSSAPDGSSAFKQDVREHLYRLAGRARIDGRSTLKLVATRRSVPLLTGSHTREFLGTVYVVPGTYAPIRQVIRWRLAPNVVATSIEDWQEYEILAPTPENQQLLSLRARHPSAHVVQGAGAYLHASGSEVPPRRRRGA